MQLQNAWLFRQQGYIDGKWMDADDQNTFHVTNPVDGSILGTAPRMGAEETRRAIDAADRAWPAWRAKTAKERAGLLRQWYDLVMANQEDLAYIITVEQGKPLKEARGEIAYGAAFIEWFAEEAKRVYGDIIPHPQADKRIVIIKQPVGVCAAITPWNSPSSMLLKKAAPALAAGCVMVAKPASQTPFSALALAALAERAGIPPGVFNIVTGPAEAIGSEMTSNPLVSKVTFTGSTEVGKRLIQQAAGTVKKMSMELGGNAAFIVFDDADLDAAVDGALAAKYRNSGQVCNSANRFLVQDGVYDEFARRLADRVRSLKVGPGLEPEVAQGPLIDERAVAKVEAYVTDALRQGARAVVGGKRHGLGGSFYEPSVLTDVLPTMRIVCDEIFGPVAPLIRFHTEAEAIQMANNTVYGLASYFYTRDIGRIWRVGEGLAYGMLGINTGEISTEVAPFGGIKQSGFGREGSKYGLEDYLEIKYLCLGGIESGGRK
jgi:succinate-semialdehyde dehydrogenase / glutarate-semialdehyde dehydrogenase